MRHLPSISAADRLDRDMYLVLEDFSNGAAWRETDEDRTDYRSLISDLLTDQYDHPLRVVAFNPLEGWSRDTSEDVAHELEQRVAEGHEVTVPVREFIERFTGRPIGVQLFLPTRESDRRCSSLCKPTVKCFWITGSIKSIPTNCGKGCNRYDHGKWLW